MTLSFRFGLPGKLVKDVEWLSLNCDPEIVLDNRTLPKGHFGLWKQSGGYNNDPGYIARRIIYHWGARAAGAPGGSKAGCVARARQRRVT